MKWNDAIKKNYQMGSWMSIMRIRAWRTRSVTIVRQMRARKGDDLGCRMRVFAGGVLPAGGEKTFLQSGRFRKDEVTTKMCPGDLVFDKIHCHLLWIIGKISFCRGMVAPGMLIHRLRITVFRQATAGNPHVVDIRAIGRIPSER
jgi:hypothetical protein